MRHPSAVWSFDFNSGSPDIVVCGRADGHITVWNAQSALRIDNIMPDPEWMHGTMESSLLACVNLSNFGLGLGFRIYPVLHVLVSKLRSIWFDIHQILLHPSLIPMSFLAWNRQTPWWKNSSLARHLSISYRTPAEQDLAIHRITLENDNCSVRWIQCIMIALSRSSTKLTVRNDVMDFLLTLFLPTCSVSEVLGINDAVQNVFTFFQAFKTRLQGTPSALELGCTNPDRFSVSCAF
ncbi:hypothetical protein BASA61_006658 [Batrachochytrium salamandrivorans]|nr:hypothetical protein BASA61_006658 [Batrachochytrium salamandrivorans]